MAQNAFGEMAVNWQLITAGKFNTCYRIECNHRPASILRVGPPPDAILFQHERNLLQRENRIQQKLNQVSDKFPVNLFFDFNHELIERDYVFQNFLQGQLWDSVKSDLSDEQNNDLWSKLAPIIGGIHRLSGESFGFPLPNEMHQSWSHAMIDWIKGMVVDLEHYQLDSVEPKRFLELVTRGSHFLD